MLNLMMLLNDKKFMAKGGDDMLLKVISTGSQAGNCYALIADNGEILLLDFGCEPNKILRGIKYKIFDVCGALLSHEHG